MTTLPSTLSLSHRSDWRVLLWVAVYFALIAVLWLVELPLFAWSILIIGACLSAYGCSAIAHNTVHVPIFHHDWMNRCFQLLLTLSYGWPVSLYVASHNLSHHEHLQTSKDAMRTTGMRFRSNLLNFSFFFFTAVAAISRGERLFIRYMRIRHRGWFSQFLIESVLLVLVSVALLCLDWRKFLFVWMLPHGFAAWGIITINYLQHDGCDPNSEFNHSRNFLGLVFNIITFNSGFHTVHHRNPWLHWSDWPAEHRSIEDQIHPGLIEPSIATYTWRVLIWPGVRMKFDGTRVELTEVDPPEDWIPDGKPLPPISLGAGRARH